MRINSSGRAVSDKPRKVSYAALVVQVVRDSPGPIPFAEILRRVERRRRIDTRSPKSTIRSALTQCYLIANTGEGRYGWYPRLISGSRVRAPLRKPDLDRAEPRIVFDDDVRELLWPSFFAIQSLSDREPVVVVLPDGAATRMPLDFFGHGIWGTTGSPPFWAWLGSLNVTTGDALIFEAVDAEARRYRVTFEPRAALDADAVKRRTEEVTQVAAQHLWNRRAHGSSVWDMAKYLLATGQYKHPVPPDPISGIWNRILHEFTSREEASRPSRTRRKRGYAVYQLKITLKHFKPPIWRRVLVTSDMTLNDLHWIIQEVMGWTNSHLHQFAIGPAYYSDPTFGLDEVRDECQTQLGDVIAKEKTRFVYEYDFGDGWQHELLVEKILPAEAGETYPKCLAGQRACPPEDCGGVWGYGHFLEAIKNPGHPEHEDMLAWIGGSFDPEQFDLERVNKRLRRLAGFK